MLLQAAPEWNSPGQDHGHLRLPGGGISATLDLSPGQPATSGWNTHSAPLTAAAWGVTPENRTTLLGNVTEIRLSVEARFGEEIQGIDNFNITAVPESDTPTASSSLSHPA